MARNPKIFRGTGYEIVLDIPEITKRWRGSQTSRYRKTKKKAEKLFDSLRRKHPEVDLFILVKRGNRRWAYELLD